MSRDKGRRVGGHLLIEVHDSERGIKYEFESTYSYMRRLEDEKININEADSELHTGSIAVSKLAALIDLAVYRATDARGADITAEEESHGADIIGRFGLLEATTLAAHILNVTVLGSIKKLELDEKNAPPDLFTQLQPRSRSWRSFIKVGLLWAAIILTSGTVAFLTSRYCMTHM